MRTSQEIRAWQRAFQYAVVAVLVIAAPTAAQADFSGDYAPSNWTVTTGAGDGSVNTLTAPASIQVIGADNSAAGTNTDFTIPAAGSGFWSFDFDWDNTDPGFGGFEFDFGGFLLNGALTSYGGPDASGSQAPIAVAAGDIIGFRVSCVDCAFGRGFLTISNFSAPLAEEPLPGVPEPGMLILVGLGTAGFAVRHLRRRRRSTVAARA